MKGRRWGEGGGREGGRRGGGEHELDFIIKRKRYQKEITVITLTDYILQRVKGNFTMDKSGI